MAVDVEIDVDLLKNEIKKTYASVSQDPERDFIFPTGRAWADDVGLPPELANVVDAAVESFAGLNGIHDNLAGRAELDQFLRPAPGTDPRRNRRQPVTSVT